MAELSDEQRALILLEERYRDDIRHQLNAAETDAKRHRLIAFFNSNLGLWLLSAIFISGLGTLYQYYENDRQHTRALEDKRFEEQQLRLEKGLEAKAARDVIIDGLDREVSYRFSRTLTKLRDIALIFGLRETGKSGRALEVASTDHDRQANKVVEELLFAPSDPRDRLNAGNADKSVASLMLELASLIENPTEHAAIQTAHQTLTARAESPVRLMAFGAPHARDAAAWLQEECVLPRWRKQGFVYTTCSPQSPFCSSNISTSTGSPVSVP